MQISRHWRMNSQRYRLQGVRYEDGKVSLQSRPAPLATSKPGLLTPIAQKEEAATSAA